MSTSVFCNHLEPRLWYTVYMPELWQAHDEPCLALVPNARSKHVYLHWKIQNHMQNVINNWIFNKT
jgi:hypothetical protein